MIKKYIKQCIRTLYVFMSVWLMLHGLEINAQQLLPLNEKAYSDSLMNILASQQSDSIKARTNFLLSTFWRSKDSVKSKEFLAKGLQLGGKYPELKALYHFYVGEYYFLRDTARAAAAYEKAAIALDKFKQPDAYLSTAAAWFNYSVMKRDEKGDDFLIDILLNKSIPLSKKGGNDQLAAHYYSQLGTILMYNSQFDKAATYNQEAINLLEDKFPESPSLMIAYLSATSNYLYSNKLKEAKINLDKAAKMLAPYPESINYPNYYYNEGLYYVTAQDYPKALVSLDKGIRMAQKLRQNSLLQMLLFKKYEVLNGTKNYPAAKKLLTQLYKEGTLTADIKNRRMVYQQLAYVNAALGQMSEAYQWSQKYSTLSDSLNNSQLAEKVSALEAKFRNAENQQKITKLEAEKEASQLTAKNTRLLIWLLALVCFFLAIGGMFGWFYYQKDKKLAQQKEINYQQQIKERDQQQQLATAQAMLEGEEREQRRIARDLHDGLGGLLAGIKMNLSALNRVKEPVRLHEELGKITTRVDNTASEVRRIAHNMMPESLFRLGLEPALEDLCHTYHSASLRVEFQAFSLNPSIPQASQLSIYRIVQELLSNAVRHARASTVLVQCSQNGRTIFITVEDDGCGFNAKANQAHAGMGLSNIRNRVAYLKGTIAINATEKEGTAIHIELQAN